MACRDRKRFSAFRKKKKAGVSSVGSKGSSDMRRLREAGRQGSIMQPGCYANDFAFYLNAKVRKH